MNTLFFDAQMLHIEFNKTKKDARERAPVVVIRVRFELTTHGLEDRCSIQLSYRTVADNKEHYIGNKDILSIQLVIIFFNF